MAFYPYLNFAGNAREAFTRYQEILGGQLDILDASGLPPDQQPPAEFAGLVMHAALSIGDHMLMASDLPPGTEVTPTNAAYVNYTVDDVAEAERVFKELCEGGTVEMPMEPTFWSPMFGMCRDRFGVNWMVNTNPSEG